MWKMDFFFYWRKLWQCSQGKSYETDSPICDVKIQKVGGVHLSQATVLDPAQILGSWENSTVGVHLYSSSNATTIFCSYL